MLKRAKKYVVANYQRVLTRVLPKNRFGDNVLATLIHLHVHKRWPGRHALFSDYLWRMKTGGELSSALRQFVSDKEFVKLYVKAVIGDAHNVRTFAVLRSVEAVDAYDFPADCAIKPTQGTGQIVIRRDGAPVDRGRIKGFFQSDLYRKGRQINYRNLAPKVIVEAIAFGRADRLDYKFFCFKGEPKIVLVDAKVYDDRRQSLFHPDWTPCKFRIYPPPFDAEIARPACLDRMLEAARKLSAHFEFIRVDFYTDGEDFLVGEITNCHASGAARFATRADEVAFSNALFSEQTACGFSESLPPTTASVREGAS